MKTGRGTEIERGSLRFPEMGSASARGHLRRFNAALKNVPPEDRSIVANTLANLRNGGKGDDGKDNKFSIRCYQNIPDNEPRFYINEDKEQNRLRIEIDTRNPKSMKETLLVAQHWNENSRTFPMDCTSRAATGKRLKKGATSAIYFPGQVLHEASDPLNLPNPYVASAPEIFDSLPPSANSSRASVNNLDDNQFYLVAPGRRWSP